jgi:SAM-dependent methyltransferase
LEILCRGAMSGLGTPLLRAGGHLGARATAALLRMRTDGQGFTFADARYGYLLHWNNRTWTNERAVEVPVIWRAVEEAQARGERVLEIGDVLFNYCPATHPVVDLGATRQGALSCDVVDYAPGERFDLIATISTLEHVGFDTGEASDPAKPARAVEHLKALLRPGGVLWVTVPLGYNPAIDALLSAAPSAFDEVRYLLRTSARPEWREASAAEVGGASYGSPFPAANAVAIARFRRSR